VAVKPVITIGDKRLKHQAAEIKNFTPNIKPLIDDLLDTFNHYPHSVGIAAPQIGESKRLIIVDARRARRLCLNNGLLVLLNPEIIAAEGKIIFREGCLSVPDYTADIVRRQNIIVRARSYTGEEKIVAATGFESVVLQHEIDHLDGILFIDRVKSIADIRLRKK
jgi:peptide deformylase